MKVNVKDARSRLSFLLDQVEKGGEVVILRRGKEVARLVPTRGEAKPLPSLKDFRSSIKIAGEPLSSVVIQGRDEERY
jgi:prevent-host-death family protein